MEKKFNKKTKKLSGIGGWLLIILIEFILSAISSIFLLAQKVISIAQGKALLGVYVSIILLLFYLAFIIASICLILLKKKRATKIVMTTLIISIVFAVWYYFLGRLIITKQVLADDLLLCLIDLTISVLMIFYFKKSKRVKNTLVK
jgi:hypothetical protein